MNKQQNIVTALEVAACRAGAVLGHGQGCITRSDGSRKKQIFGSGVELLENLVYLLPVSSKVLHYTLVLARGEHISAVAIAASSPSTTRKRCLCC